MSSYVTPPYKYSEYDPATTTLLLLLLRSNHIMTFPTTRNVTLSTHKPIHATGTFPALQSNLLKFHMA